MTFQSTKSNCLEVKRDDISFFFLHASPKLYTENYMRVFFTNRNVKFKSNVVQYQQQAGVSYTYKTDVV